MSKFNVLVFVLLSDLCINLLDIRLLKNFCCLCDGSFNRTLNYKTEVIKLRGLPWSTTAEEIVKFFDGCNIINGTSGVHIIMSNEGRPSGIAYVEMERDEDMELACSKDQEYLDHRYIEVFREKKSEMIKAVRRSELSVHRALNDGCIRMRGLPFQCTQEEIEQFFEGLDIVKNGIVFKTDNRGNKLGEAYVIFKTKEIAEKALEKHKEKMLHRYVEVFRSSLGEVRLERLSQRSFIGIQSPFKSQTQSFNDGGRSGMRLRVRNRGGLMQSQGIRSPYSVHMRGLPFKVSIADVQQFFSPLTPVNVHIIYNVDGRPSGEADVEFASREEAVQAKAKDRHHMQHRYIELT